MEPHTFICSNDTEQRPKHLSKLIFCFCLTYLVIFVWSKSKGRISSDADRAPVHGMQEIPTFFWACNNSLTTKLCVVTANNPLFFFFSFFFRYKTLVYKKISFLLWGNHSGCSLGFKENPSDAWLELLLLLRMDVGAWHTSWLLDILVMGKSLQIPLSKV